MDEFYEFLKENGCTLSYSEVEEKLLSNGKDIVETIQLGGRDNSRAKRKD